MARKSLKLIPNWRRAWRMATMHVAGLAVIWGVMPEDLQAAMLEAVGLPASRVPAILGVLFMATRLVQQPSVSRE
jgi:hypothetical protein